MTSPQYKGTVRKGKEPDTIEVTLFDSWGWVIRSVGTLQPDRTYKLVGTATDESNAPPSMPDDEVLAASPKKTGTGKYWTSGELVRNSQPDPHSGVSANGVRVLTNHG